MTDEKLLHVDVSQRFKDELGIDITDLNLKDVQVWPAVPETPLEHYPLKSDWSPTPDSLSRIFLEAQKGCTEPTIALVGAQVDLATWFSLKELYPVIQETIDQGRAVGEAHRASVILNGILDPENPQRYKLASLWLKNVAGWDRSEQSPTTNLPRLVTFDDHKLPLDHGEILAAARKIYHDQKTSPGARKRRQPR